MISPSIYLKRPVYHINTYAKPATFLFILRSHLGEDLFNKTVHEYIKRWNGKHPTPYDFFFTINNSCEQNLSWLFKPWFFEFGYVDLAIKSVSKTAQEYEIIIEKKGKYPAPINLKIVYDDKSIDWVYESVSIWSGGQSYYTIKRPLIKNMRYLELSDPIVPDADLSNNYLEFD
jgi:aminopeptidase N